ncbi:MAG TPA: class I SAM-dependent methyltransferase [Smithella sp.]|nr:class I SAM-dependent methyltransferase [Smithella sp.]MDM7987177.1 class I SAM-dependent methyltransferase [Smithella sp.]HNY49829.1 class I SAM-dependent methyltransferase [Smithella sp.]HOG91085.1 class I SAM-dependent methyltransferase [Smithella sp.]HOU51296.1 class I SAM-dependent methyltransferase [Smithella sp.]
MITVEINKLNLKPGDVVLDAGCGLGRHLRHLARIPDLKIYGIDKNTWALRETSKSLETQPDALTKDYLVSIADINKLPFADASFDCVICSEVLEHIPDHQNAIRELDRILKPNGTLAVSVPRYFAERICWLISHAYHNEEGGHIRIYRKKQLYQMLTGQGFRCWKINYKHALHAPYWWLKCLVGLKNEEHPLVRAYRKFLEWDIMKKPRSVRMLEEMLNPFMGKSIVYYLKKG